MRGLKKNTTYNISGDDSGKILSEGGIKLIMRTKCFIHFQVSTIK